MKKSRLTLFALLLLPGFLLMGDTLRREIITTSQFAREANTNETAAGWRTKLLTTGLNTNVIVGALSLNFTNGLLVEISDAP